jgi:membrane protease subunit HflK
MYLDVMQQIFSNTTKLMVDSRSGNNLMYLPLDKLISQSAADASSARSNLPATTPPAAAIEPTPNIELPRATDARSRESRNSRDRETR